MYVLCAARVRGMRVALCCELGGGGGGVRVGCGGIGDVRVGGFVVGGVRFVDVAGDVCFVVMCVVGVMGILRRPLSLLSPRFGSPAIISRLAGNLPGRGVGLPLLDLVI